MARRHFANLSIPAILAVLALAVPLMSNPYHQHMLAMMAIGIILALSLNLIYGHAGLISFGHAGFYGLGAYVATLLQVKWHLSFVPAVLLTLVAVFVIAAAVGWPVLRLKDFYLGMATLAFGLLVSTGLMQWIKLTGGPSGISVPEAMVFGHSLDKSFHAIVLAAAALAGLFTWSLENSRIGVALQAVEGDEVAASAAGIDTTHFKILAFSFSGAMAALAGVMYAHLNFFIAPEVFSLHTSILILIMVVVGGLGSNWGVSLGAVLFTFLPRLLDRFQDATSAIYGLILLLFLVYLPNGIAGIPQMLAARKGARP